MTAYSAGPSGIVSHVIFVLAGIKCFVIHSPIMVVLLVISYCRVGKSFYPLAGSADGYIFYEPLEHR